MTAYVGALVRGKSRVHFFFSLLFFSLFFESFLNFWKKRSSRFPTTTIRHPPPPLKNFQSGQRKKKKKKKKMIEDEDDPINSVGINGRGITVKKTKDNKKWTLVTTGDQNEMNIKCMNNIKKSVERAKESQLIDFKASVDIIDDKEEEINYNETSKRPFACLMNHLLTMKK